MAGTQTTLPYEIEFAKQAFYGAMAADPDTKVLIDENAGLQEAMWRAIEPELRRSSVEGNAAFVALIAAVYRSRLTPTELDGVHVFFSSATGRKLVRSMYAGLDPGPLIAETVRGAEQTSAETIRQTADSATANVVAAMGPEDEPALRALARAVPMTKMQAIGAEVQKLTLEHINKEDPALNARIETAIEAAAVDYFAQLEKAD